MIIFQTNFGQTRFTNPFFFFSAQNASYRKKQVKDKYVYLFQKFRSFLFEKRMHLLFTLQKYVKIIISQKLSE